MRCVYLRKDSFPLLRADIRSHTGTVWFGRVPLLLLPRCYLVARSRTARWPLPR